MEVQLTFTKFVVVFAALSFGVTPSIAVAK